MIASFRCCSGSGIKVMFCVPGRQNELALGKYAFKGGYAEVKNGNVFPVRSLRSAYTP